eukprot:maker-scaffold280_size224562-snap-gene-0.13 protein:Tk08827 transcript:maker-scaffold280_size224562-snap-gene-0.13-mRNA-1 annotation:"GF13899"
MILFHAPRSSSPFLVCRDLFPHPKFIKEQDQVPANNHSTIQTVKEDTPWEGPQLKTTIVRLLTKLADCEENFGPKPGCGESYEMELLKAITILLGSLAIYSQAETTEIRSSGYYHLTEEDYLAAETLDDEVLWAGLDETFKTAGGPMGSLANVTNPEDEDAMKSLWGIWSKGVVPYRIVGEFSANDRAAIAKSFEYLERNTCIKFLETNGNVPSQMDILSANLGGFCYTVWTFNGVGPSATVRLTPNSACTMPRTILHEILHGFSWYHTHKRPDRDSHVRINWNNVIGDKREEFEKCSGCCCKTYDTPYDCDSVMHYAKDQMSTGGDTIEPMSSSCNLLRFSEWNTKNPYLSNHDLNFLKQQYPC